ncbi:MAG TPA: glycosyltransferase family 4 protein [Polyangia bacterium]|nr:glycosyltransferase family 4 protein [Polyangia bacterium]
MTGEVPTRRFAFLAPNFNPRTCGIGDHSVRLGAELVRRGHAVHVFSRLPVEPNPIDPTIAATGAPGATPLAIARRLWPLIRAWAPTDLVIQYTGQMLGASRFGSPAAPWLAAVAHRAGIQVTLIAHELYVGFEKRPDVFVAAALLQTQFAALLMSVDRSFVTTDSRLKYIEPFCRALGRPAPRVIRVGANALPLPARRVPGRARIGLFSSAAAGKRFDVVLGAFSGVLERWPEAELVLLGDLGDPTSPRVREVTDIIRAHPAAARIRVTGKLSLADVSREIADLDLYLFPMNTGANTRSGTLPVALGAGLPVICVHGAETDDALFRSDENVVFARELTGPAFAEAALRVLADPALATRVANGARALYDAHLSWQSIADSLVTTVA